MIERSRKKESNERLTACKCNSKTRPGILASGYFPSSIRGLKAVRSYRMVLVLGIVPSLDNVGWLDNLLRRLRLVL